MTLARAIAAALPLTRGERTLICSGVEGEGRRVALELELQVMEDGDLVGTMGQTVLLESLEADDAEELLARASERLEALSPDAWVPTPAQLLAPPFRPLPAAAIATADAHAIYDRLQLQAHAAGHESRFDRLDVWPIEARTIYFLVVAEGRLGSHGLGPFLSQAPLEEVVGVMDALEEARCDRLARLLRQGLTLVGSTGGAELLLQIDDDWIDDEGLPMPDGTSWSSIDSRDEGGTGWLVREELAPAIARYVDAHRAALAVRD